MSDLSEQAGTEGRSWSVQSVDVCFPICLEAGMPPTMASWLYSMPIGSGHSTAGFTFVPAYLSGVR